MRHLWIHSYDFRQRTFKYERPNPHVRALRKGGPHPHGLQPGIREDTMAKPAKNGSVAHVLETVEKEGVRWYDLWFAGPAPGRALWPGTHPASPPASSSPGIPKLDGSSI